MNSAWDNCIWDFPPVFLSLMSEQTTSAVIGSCVLFNLFSIKCEARYSVGVRCISLDILKELYPVQWETANCGCRKTKIVSRHTSESPQLRPKLTLTRVIWNFNFCGVLNFYFPYLRLHVQADVWVFDKGRLNWIRLFKFRTVSYPHHHNIRVFKSIIWAHYMTSAQLFWTTRPTLRWEHRREWTVSIRCRS